MIRTSVFLAAFREPDEEIHVRALPPRGADKTVDNAPLKLAGTVNWFTTNKVQLIEVNKTKGIFFVVNPGGDKDADITRFVAFFAEHDSQSLAEQYQNLDQSPLPASILVETKKSVHAYWLIQGSCSENNWRDVQATLINYFGGDPKIKNPARLMRLPNFDHLSINGNGLERKRVVVRAFQPGRRYTVDEMQKAFIKSPLAASRAIPVLSSFEYHEDRHEEFCRRIVARAGGNRNSSGNYDVRCLAHNGKGNSGLVYFPDSGAVHCNNDCDYYSLLRAEGLSDEKLPKSKHEQDKLDEDEGLSWPALHGDALYGLAGDIVRALEPQTESDPVAILLQTLVWFGNCIGRTVHFPVERDRHYLNFDAVLVGATSHGRKGTSAGQVRGIFESVDEEWTNNRIQSGLSSGEGVIWAVRDPIEEKRPIKKSGRVVDYETVISDHGVADKRLLVLETEFGGVLRVIGREGNTLSPVIRQAWDSGQLRVLTKNNPARCSTAHISIVGHITLEELRRNLDETETANGFANRILWALVRRSKLLPEGGERVNLNRFISRLQSAIEYTRQFNGAIKRESDARELWFQCYEELSAGSSGLLGSVTSRAEAQVVRLSLAYAMLDCAASVRIEHLRAALGLWRYCHDSAAYIFGRSTGDRTADTIVSALKECAPDGLTRTDISNLMGRHKNTSELGRALALLEQRSLIRSEREATDGRSRVRYFYLPAAKKANEANKVLSSSTVSNSAEPQNSLNSLNSPDTEYVRVLNHEQKRFEPTFDDPERQAAWDSWKPAGLSDGAV